MKNKTCAQDSPPAPRPLIIELVILFLAVVGLAAAGCLGWDFVSSLPSADMGAW